MGYSIPVAWKQRRSVLRSRGQVNLTRNAQTSEASAPFANARGLGTTSDCGARLRARTGCVPHSSRDADFQAACEPAAAHYESTRSGSELIFVVAVDTVRAILLLFLLDARLAFFALLATVAHDSSPLECRPAW